MSKQDYEKTEKAKAYRKKFYQETRSALWRKYSVLKSSAKRSGRDFTLSKHDYEVLVSRPCEYCGGLLPEVGYGLDRIDNRLGYVHGNCNPCCETCNEKKGRLESLGFTCPRTVELLLELVK